MVKRLNDAEQAGEYDGSKSKRQKTTQPEKIEEIFTARQLQDLLAFRQDDPETLRNGLASVKAFLENLLYHKDDQNRGAHLAILGDYLDLAKPKDPAGPFLGDLIQAWSYSVQTSNERLASSVSSLLALLLKTLSGILELREPGLSLCRTLLQREQLKLFSRGISSESHKEHLISPCLRLLTEIVSFDGGALAYQVFNQQDLTLNPRYLDRNLRLHRAAGEEDNRRLSVRSNTVRYILAHLKFQSVENRIRLLDIRNIFKTLFDNVNNDPLEILREIIKIFESQILSNEAIPRKSKSTVVSDRAMTGLLEVVRAGESISSGTSDLNSRSREALDFLTRICTNSKLGVLLPHGWYPPGSHKSSTDDNVGDTTIEQTEADLLESLDTHVDSIPVRNTILSRFLQALRPHASASERSLALSTFQAAPELVADYFLQNRDKYSLEPKLTNTWLGYASFFFSVIDLPVPRHFGRKSYGSSPPPVAVIMENILPSPLTSKVLTRCLNQNSDLITLFAVRILTISLEKLDNVLRMLKEAEKDQSSYQGLAARICADFVDQSPALKDIVNATRAAAEGNVTLRESSTRLIRMYQEVLPQTAVEDSFDVAARLLSVMEDVIDKTATDNKQFLIELELQHLVAVAGLSTGMKWWHKQGKLPFSTFTTLLQLQSTRSDTATLGVEIEKLLKAVLLDNGILHDSSSETSAFRALIVSLQADGSWSPGEATYKYIDECLGRLVRKPVKYLDDLDNIRAELEADSLPVSVLVLACLEQAPFLSRETALHQEEVLHWLSRFLQGLEKSGESQFVIKDIRKRLGSSGLTLPQTEVHLPQSLSVTDSKRLINQSDETVPVKESKITKQPESLFVKPPEESSNRPELLRWQKLEVEEAIQDRVLADLGLCLCSQYAEIRVQGLASLRSFDNKLAEASLDSKEQFQLLVGELIETAQGIIHERPLSYIAGSFATRATKILTDPTHLMFSKVNKYLLKDPIWNVRRLPEYWLSKTALDMPDDDDTYWKEVAWVMDMLVDGLRTIEDVGILRSRNVFESILSLSWSPGCTQVVRDSILQLVYRAIVVGGSSTLITGCGIVSWLSMLKTSRLAETKDIEFVATCLADSIDEAKVRDWSGGLLVKQLNALQAAA